MFARWVRDVRRSTDLGLGPDAFAGLANSSPDLLAIADGEEIVFANAAGRRAITGSDQ